MPYGIEVVNVRLKIAQGISRFVPLRSHERVHHLCPHNHVGAKFLVKGAEVAHF